MARVKYVITPRDLYDENLWPHLIDRLPNGIRAHTHQDNEEEAKDLAGKILDDYMSMASDEMIETGAYWPLPCFKTGYIYIKDQKEYITKNSKTYKYDIDLDGAWFAPVFKMDMSIFRKAQGYYNVLMKWPKFKKIQENAKKGVKYNVSTK